MWSDNVFIYETKCLSKPPEDLWLHFGVLQPTVLGQLDSHIQTDKFRSLPQITHKSDVKIDNRALGQITPKI